MQAIFGDLRLQDLSLQATTLPQIHAGVPELSEQDCTLDETTRQFLATAGNMAKGVAK